MEKTPQGTSVGVDDPYQFVERCDHLTDDGRCRYAAEHARHDPEFAAERRADDLRCPAADYEARRASEQSTGERSEPGDGEWEWSDCPHFRARNRDRECVRCGLEERRRAHDDERPLLEEHHLEYRDDDRRELSHEITVYLCRWCHAKVHDSWARVDDDASPDPEAIAEAEGRRSDEQAEAAFSTAAERYDEE
ncbi:DUF7097 family protein [Halorarius halobius]|uniref:DUF7097 family protein n=1 Tax=Halorarius halobius TaxID=2962671 RepID=UPI0020CDDB5D|nr:hypothetical protein [Halorarius halobius]